MSKVVLSFEQYHAMRAQMYQTACISSRSAGSASFWAIADHAMKDGGYVCGPEPGGQPPTPDEVENLRMQLAGCGVAAQCNTRESAALQRIGKDSPYYCASYQDVCDAVDREIANREALAAARKEERERVLEVGHDWLLAMPGVSDSDGSFWEQKVRAALDEAGGER